MKCTFCEKTITPGTGKIYVLKSGKTYRFCTLKCQKNMLKLKRKAREQKWVSKSDEAKAKLKK
ncbi:MAG TPA: 50S ribosomal protein L24e [Candidatus Woesearchaeota archaeon]|nr:50S ribosomal protein L24e [Candidatus Woesearchaeota archaeon]